MEFEVQMDREMETSDPRTMGPFDLALFARPNGPADELIFKEPRDIETAK